MRNAPDKLIRAQWLRPFEIDLSRSPDFRALLGEGCEVDLASVTLTEGVLALRVPEERWTPSGIKWHAFRPGPPVHIIFTIDPSRSVNPELADQPDLRRALRDALQFVPAALAKREAEELAELTSKGDDAEPNLSQARTGGRL